MDAAKNKTTQIPFETILEKMEEIVLQLEANELPLDEALEKFEEGIALSRAGSMRLEQAERRIEEIIKDGSKNEYKSSSE